MGASMMVRWEGWEGRSLEHLALQEEADGITAESVILGRAGGQPFAASYRISCDSGWRTREVAIGLIGSSRQLLLTADGEGRWRAGAGADLPALRGAVDVDITATPFTNTLPIRRLGLGRRRCRRHHHRLHHRARSHDHDGPAALHLPRAQPQLHLRIPGQRLQAPDRDRRARPGAHLSRVVSQGAVAGGRACAGMFWQAS